MSDSPLPFHRVAVTAIGVISPMGQGLGATLRSLRAGKDCVSEIGDFGRKFAAASG